MRRVEQPGFTIVELMLALALSGIVLAGVSSLAATSGATRDRLEASEQRMAWSANGPRELERLLRDAQPRLDSTTPPLLGDDTTMSFGTLCTMARGWRARCRVELAIARSGTVASVVAQLSTGERLVLLRRQSSGAALSYLDPAAPRWLRSWADSTRLPAAVAIAGDQDTLIVPIGFVYE